MGFFDNYTKANTEKLASNLLQSITYHSQDAGALYISALFNVVEITDGQYVMQKGEVGVFVNDVTPVTGDSITDTDGRVWYIDSFNQQRGDMIYMNCYANNEGSYDRPS